MKYKIHLLSTRTDYHEALIPSIMPYEASHKGFLIAFGGNVYGSCDAGNCVLMHVSTSIEAAKEWIDSKAEQTYDYTIYSSIFHNGRSVTIFPPQYGTQCVVKIDRKKTNIDVKLHERGLLALGGVFQNGYDAAIAIIDSIENLKNLLGDVL